MLECGFEYGALRRTGQDLGGIAQRLPQIAASNEHAVRVELSRHLTNLSALGESCGRIRIGLRKLRTIGLQP
ncbi:MAG: hypothetical protein ACREVY_15600 [Gammaproteobacteria bacterium]